jgi:hypothetical protein
MVKVDKLSLFFCTFSSLQDGRESQLLNVEEYSGIGYVQGVC